MASRRARCAIAALLGALLFAAACSSDAKDDSSNDPWWKGVAVSDMRGYAKGQDPEVAVVVNDNKFNPSVLRIDPGVTVAWTNRGRSVHNILKSNDNKDFGGQFGTDRLEAGGEYKFRFDKPGTYQYFCSLHGSQTSGMVGLVAVGDVDIDTGVVRGAAAPTESGTLRVPEDYKTIQAAVDAAKPGSLVLISPGVYHEAVRVDPGHENIVLRGTDRNSVILDGEFDEQKPNGVTVLADGVAIENMTARNYPTNGFYWRGIKGYRGSYLNTYRTGDYGIYAFDSEIGQIDHAYAVGSRDASFYIGQCRNCRATITDSVGEWSGIGYSGTNAGGNLVVANNTFRFNRVGIVPNSETGEELWPQRSMVIAGNRVYSNHNEKTPSIEIAIVAFGNGILIAGGQDNIVEHNLVWDHDDYGIGVIPLPEKILDPDDPKAINFEAKHNTVRNNVVRDSRVADLALVELEAPTNAQGNCFSDNVHTTSSPVDLEKVVPCGSSAGAFEADLVTFARLFTAEQPAEVDYKTAPLPPLRPQPNMPDPQNAPVRPANSGLPIRIDLDAITTPTS